MDVYEDFRKTHDEFGNNINFPNKIQNMVINKFKRRNCK